MRLLKLASAIAVSSALMFCGGSAHAEVVPEVATQVEMSSSDVNRIVCPVDIRDVVFSQEKSVTVKLSGENAFVKFQIKLEEGKEAYATTPAEFYVICGDSVYNLIGIPQRIPSQTIKLSSKTKKIKDNIAVFKGMPIEEKVIKLVRAVYKDEIPESFTITGVEKDFEIFSDMRVRLVKTVVPEGEGLQLKEYRISNRSGGEVRLSEKIFLKDALTTNTMAVAVESHVLKPGEITRVFVVEGAQKGVRHAE